ncbi:MAG: cadherin repeat domain-containing protein [Candidatus Korobacteraceae bacterium]
MKLDAAGKSSGAPLKQGNFVATIRIRDSYSPPQEVTQQLVVDVRPSTLLVGNTVPERVPLGSPFQGTLVITGGTPPYTLVHRAGAFPPGFGQFNTNTGEFSGTPILPGTWSPSIFVTDSGSPAQFVSHSPTFRVEPLRGRNDSISTATPLGNGTTSGSISPFDESRGVTHADVDVYRLRTNAGSVVNLEIRSKRDNPQRPLDSVLELLDGNGQRLSFCRPMGDSTSDNFTATCLNDDLSSNPHIQDSVLDFRAPGDPGTAFVFYARVFDWSGNARPDMTYNLEVSGVLEPLIQQPSFTFVASKGLTFNERIPAFGGISPVTWLPPVGSLPPGISFVGPAFDGVPTQNGVYTFQLQASDSGSPPEVISLPVTIHVTDPLVFATPATMPDACIGKPYSFSPQLTGGFPPYSVTQWFPLTAWTLNINMLTLAISGTPQQGGTFSASLHVRDSGGKFTQQTLSVTVKNCP